MDTFTGADGTIVAPGAMWGYTNIGVERSDWATYPRPDAQDLYCISNNQLFMYVGPSTNAVGVYNKCQAAIMPGSYGDPDWITFTNGQVEMSMDVVASAANAGNRWGFSKETKPVLNSANDPVDNGGGNSHYRFQIQVGPDDLNVAQQLSVQGAYTTAFNIAIGNDVALPVSLKMTIDETGAVNIYTNGLLIVSTNGLVPPSEMQTVYPYIWDGIFAGEGTTPPTEAYLKLDNYNVKWTPEPGAFALLLLALPLLRKLG
jgi:hypothetical protein